MGDRRPSVVGGPELPKSALAVQAALDAAGLELEVVELPASTRTAKEAAAAVGCSVAQIAKSIVFRTKRSDRPVLVIASGANRIDEAAVAGLIGEEIAQARPDFVRQATGFAIGGVPPCGHARPMATVVDRDLLALGEIWAAAGTPHAVFRLTPEQLVTLTGGTVAAVEKRS